MTLTLKTKTPLYIMAAAVLTLGTLYALVVAFMPPSIYNYTPSEPLGLYRLTYLSPGQYKRGMTVVFPVPAPFRPMVDRRRYANPGTPMLKKIWGMPGDIVCETAGWVALNGRIIGPVFRTDTEGRPLPRIRGCYRIPPGYFFPASNYIKNSFDGRYIGVVPFTAIEAEATPEWTF